MTKLDWLRYVEEIKDNLTVIEKTLDYYGDSVGIDAKFEDNITDALIAILKRTADVL
jgi:hypothetical protein